MATKQRILSKTISRKGTSSSEEEDLFQRSLKKSKNNEFGSTDNKWPKLGEGVKKPWESGPSFAEKLQGINRHAIVDVSAVNDNELYDDPLSESDHIESNQDEHEPLCVIGEDPHRNFPTFTFSGRMKKRLYKAWNRAVIVNLLGRDIGYKLLLSIMQHLWAKRGVINLINISNGFFVVKFTNNDDYRGNAKKPEEPIPKNREDHLEVNMVPEVTSGLNFDVWKVVSKPRRQWKGGKEKSSADAQRSNDGSRFEVLASHNSSSPGLVEKQGSGIRKHGKSKSKVGDLRVGKSGRSEKRTRDVMQQGAIENKTLSITYEKSNEESKRDGDMMAVQDVNLMLEGPVGVEVVENANPKEGAFDSFHLEPGEGVPLPKLEGKFWMASRALEPDDVWEEEAQMNCVMVEATHRSACEMDNEAQVLGEGGTMRNCQFIHLRGCGVDNRPLLITAIYAIPDAHHKRVIWEELRHLASSIMEPWIVFFSAS
ncbi:hypothetical protein K1719_029913 [Acacia pycnantha]|nr:hypothetical protein K1719_029913 [Acacia pycnantha]